MTEPLVIDDPAEAAPTLHRTLGEVLACLTEAGHPGTPCHRTSWIRDDTIARWHQIRRATQLAAYPAEVVNAEERPEDTVRRYAGELGRLARGLAERGVRMLDGPVEAAVDTALATIGDLRTHVQWCSSDEAQQLRAALQRLGDGLYERGIQARDPGVWGWAVDTALTVIDELRARPLGAALDAIRSRDASVQLDDDDAPGIPVTMTPDGSRVDPADLLAALGHPAQAYDGGVDHG